MADPNRALFESVVRLLAPVLDELVFVGGCTTGLFITDPAAGGIRPTKDVDAIVDVISYAKYAALAERLRRLDAFHGRGGGDIVASHDLEDIVAVVDGRPEIVGEVAAASTDVGHYIASELGALLENRDFTEALAGFLLPDAASQRRRSLLEERLRSLALP